MKIKEAIAHHIRYWAWDDTVLTTIYLIIITMLSFGGMCIFTDHSIQRYYMRTYSSGTGIEYMVWGEREYHADTKAFTSNEPTKTVEMLHILEETLKQN